MATCWERLEILTRVKNLAIKDKPIRVSDNVTAYGSRSRDSVLILLFMSTAIPVLKIVPETKVQESLHNQRPNPNPNPKKEKLSLLTRNSDAHIVMRSTLF